VGIQQLGIVLDQVFVVHLVGGVGEHQVDEGVAQVAHVLQRRRAVQRQRLAAADAVALQLVAHLVGIRQLDGHLRRHAADARTGGAERPAVDEYPVVRDLANLFDCVQTGVSRADHRHIEVLFMFSLSPDWVPTRRFGRGPDATGSCRPQRRPSPSRRRRVGSSYAIVVSSEPLFWRSSVRRTPTVSPGAPPRISKLVRSALRTDRAGA
jgi:hypothetical protein